MGALRKENRIKHIKIGNKQNCLLADDMVVDIENSK